MDRYILGIIGERNSSQSPDFNSFLWFTISFTMFYTDVIFFVTYYDEIALLENVIWFLGHFGGGISVSMSSMSSNMLQPHFFFPLLLALQLRVCWTFSPCPSILLFSHYLDILLWPFSSSLILSPAPANVMLNHSALHFSYHIVHFHIFTCFFV